MGLFLVGRYDAFCARTLMRSVVVVIEASCTSYFLVFSVSLEKPTMLSSQACRNQTQYFYQDQVEPISFIHNENPNAFCI
jgi:hypothetical protein